MTRKLVYNDQLKLYPTHIPGAKYLLNHAYKHDGQYIIFAGEIDEDSEGTEIVVHTDIGYETMHILQIILSAGQKLDYRVALLALMQLNPECTAHDICQKLYVSRGFIEKHLRLPKNSTWQKMSLSNLYLLSKVKNPTEVLKLQAQVMKTHQFGPLAAQAVKDQRKKAKK